MSLLSLPRELQLHILGLLPVRDLLRLSETCRSLKDLARDPSLWKQLVLSYKNIKNNTKACREHVARCSKLKELSIVLPKIYQGYIRSEKIMSVVMKAKSTLTTLSFDKFKLADSSFKQISQITNLTKLEINVLKLKSDGLKNLNLSNLRSLKICNLRDSLLILASECFGLEHLEVSGRADVTEPAISTFLLLSKERLKHLYIKDCELNHGFVKMMKQEYPHIKIETAPWTLRHRPPVFSCCWCW